jgi:hypothetical protein
MNKASERTELEKPLKSNNCYFKLVRRDYKKGPEPGSGVEVLDLR